MTCWHWFPITCLSIKTRRHTDKRKQHGLTPDVITSSVYTYFKSSSWMCLPMTDDTNMFNHFSCSDRHRRKDDSGIGWPKACLTQSVIILDSSLSHGLEQGRRLEINLEFSLIVVYKFRRGQVFNFIFLHK